MTNEHHDESPPITPFPAVPTGFFDESGSIATDHMCRRCGYNLRGLRHDGKCPECGTPVEFSMRGDLLRFADPDWVARVARGLTIVLWMLILGEVARFVAGVIRLDTPAVARALPLIVQGFALYGAWLVTTREPAQTGREPKISVRRVIRAALILALVGEAYEPGGLRVDYLAPQTFGIYYSMPFGTLFGMIGVFTILIYYQRLALRIPDPKLAKRARIFKWAFVGAVATLLLGIGVIVVHQIRMAPASVTTSAGKITVKADGQTATAIGQYMTYGGEIAMLIVWLMIFILLVRLRRAVAAQACLARENWTAGGAPT